MVQKRVSSKAELMKLGRKERIRQELAALGEQGVTFSGSIPSGVNFRVSKLSSCPNRHQLTSRETDEIILCNDRDFQGSAHPKGSISSRLSNKFMELGKPQIAAIAAHTDVSKLSPEAARRLLVQLTQGATLFSGDKATETRARRLQARLSNKAFQGTRFKDRKGRYGGGQR